VRCARLNKRQQDTLNDEKIICHPRLKLVKKENARSRAGHFRLENVLIGRRRQKDRGNSGL